MNLSDAVRGLRSACGQTQQAFSNRLGASMITVCRWEIGDRHPSPRFLGLLWNVAIEQQRPDLAQPFAEGFLKQIGRPLIGAQVLAAITEIERLAGLLSTADNEAAKDRARRIIAICNEVEGLI